MWSLAAELGFEGGRVLEPGCGSGNFIGLAPPGVEMVGVELDPTTADIAHQLYGERATIRTGRLEETPLPDGSFDLVIGNVPFADVRPYDPRYNTGKHTLHNYFLLRSLHLTRPGGLVIALTSRYTLDARNGAAREEMASLSDLVGAARLPERAFARSSGTDVVVDLVVFRRRPNGTESVDSAWLRTEPFIGTADGHEPVPVNQYFTRHPEMVLGELTTTRGMYRDGELTVAPIGLLDQQLAQAVEHLRTRARDRGLTMLPRPGGDRERVVPTSAGGRGPGEPGWQAAFAIDGSFVLGRDGQVGRLHDGEITRFSPRFKKDLPELRRLIGLRDAARQVLATQLAGATDADVAAAQQVLHERYGDYVRLYGPINRSSTARSGRYDKKTGEEIMRRMRPSMGGFRDDPDWALVSALEMFDEATQHARPAPIFSERVVSPPPERDRAETPAEAVAVCLDETGEVTARRVAELLGLDEDEVRERLDGLVFENPEAERLEPAARYLSGNVRKKLAAARAAAEVDPRFAANVSALEQAMPRQLEPAEITARLGAPWIDASDIEDFCAETLGLDVSVEHLAEVGSWATSVRSGGRQSVLTTSTWGTKRADAVTLLDASLNQRLHTVTDETPSGKRVRNDAETLAARDKQEKLGDRFSAWVWEDPERARRIADRYNELFCSTVVPAYDGGHLTLPGLSDTFTPRKHQRDAVARVLTEGRVLLGHCVGAGKTATMVMAAMELRRLGSAAKPAIVVPNHMLEQFSREWLQLYPNARLLIADKDRLTKDRRKAFVARCATGDWDGVIFTQAGFESIPLGKELWTAYLGQELENAQRALGVSQANKGISVKRLERKIQQLETTYMALLKEEAKDDGVAWEETGIDYLFVDEAHLYKNRRIVTSIDGVASAGSQRAQQLDAKLWALRRRHGPRVVTLATATPVANSMAELWVMESYLHPDTLAEIGMDKFDAWAATFGRTHTALELAPDGGSYRMKTRFARFQNVPELLGIYREVADVQTAEDLALPVPELAEGTAQTVVVPASAELQAYMSDLVDRAEAVRGREVEPDEDNMLKIAGDGRRAALDLRLVGEPPPPQGGKTAHAARRIAAIHHANSSRVYLDDQGQPAERTGALQLVFCDVSTPATGAGWNAYDELRDQLVRRGVSDDAIRYMQHARNDDAKAALFKACRAGQVAVLIGSTETMGVGTNVQARAVALHHLDAPWRPADIEQREGRILRQGNQNETVEIIRYVTEGSFDTFMWQTLQRKSEFISQISRGDMPDRDVDDVGEQSLSYAEVKALATGNPLILEKAGVDADLVRLARLHRAYQEDQRQLRQTADGAAWRAGRCRAAADETAKTLERVVDTRGDRFRMTVDGQQHTKRAEAGNHLKALLADELARTPPGATPAYKNVGSVGGLTVVARPSTRFEDAEIEVGLAEIDGSWRYLADDWADADPTGLVRAIENAVHRLPETLRQLQDGAEAARAEAERARARLGQPWEHEHEYSRLLRRQQELDEALTQESDESPPPARVGALPDGTGAASFANAAELRPDPVPTPDAGGISI